MQPIQNDEARDAYAAGHYDGYHAGHYEGYLAGYADAANQSPLTGPSNALPVAAVSVPAAATFDASQGFAQGSVAGSGAGSVTGSVAQREADHATGDQLDQAQNFVSGHPQGVPQKLSHEQQPGRNSQWLGTQDAGSQDVGAQDQHAQRPQAQDQHAQDSQPGALPYPALSTGGYLPPRQSSNPHAGLNILLFVGSALIVLAAALMVAVMGTDGAKFNGIIALVLGFYGAGIVLYPRVARLRIAAIAFLGVGLALIPLAGVAVTFYFDVDAQLSWSVTSVVGLLAYVVAAFITRSEFVAYLSMLFAASTITAPMAGLQSNLVWQFVAIIALSTCLNLLGFAKGNWLPAQFRRPCGISGTYMPVLALVASILTIGITPRFTVGLVLLVSAAHYATQYFAAPAGAVNSRHAYFAVTRVCLMVGTLVVLYTTTSIGIWATTLWATFALGNAVLSLVRLPSRVKFDAYHAQREFEAEQRRSAKARAEAAQAEQSEQAARAGQAAQYDGAVGEVTQLPSGATNVPMPGAKTSLFGLRERLDVLHLGASYFVLLLTSIIGIRHYANSYETEAPGAVAMLLSSLAIIALGVWTARRVNNAYLLHISGIGVILLATAVHVTGVLVYNGGVITSACIFLFTCAPLVLVQRFKVFRFARPATAGVLIVLAAATPFLSLGADFEVMSVILLLVAVAMVLAHWSLRIWWLLIPGIALFFAAGTTYLMATDWRDDAATIAFGITLVVAAGVQQVTYVGYPNGQGARHAWLRRSQTFLIAQIFCALAAMIGGLIRRAWNANHLEYDWQTNANWSVYIFVVAAIPIIDTLQHSFRQTSPVVMGTRRRNYCIAAIMGLLGAVLVVAIGTSVASVGLIALSIFAASVFLGGYIAHVTGTYFAADAAKLSRARAAAHGGVDPRSAELERQIKAWLPNPRVATIGAPQAPLPRMPWLHRTAASVSIILLVFLGCIFAYLLGDAAHTVYIAQMVIYTALGVLAQFTLLRNLALVGLILSMLFLFQYNPWVTLMVAGFILIGIVVATLLRTEEPGDARGEPANQAAMHQAQAAQGTQPAPAGNAQGNAAQVVHAAPARQSQATTSAPPAPTALAPVQAQAQAQPQPPSQQSPSQPEATNATPTIATNFTFEAPKNPPPPPART